MNPIRKEFQYGEHLVVIETGEIARQADGAVFLDMEGTTLLVTVVAKKEAIPGRDFFPLTINYQEKTYSAGKIPGGFFKREGRPSEKETLTSRLIDRPIRPLFPEGYTNEVQIIATVLSLNPEVDPDVLAILGASAALAISGLPFNGPIAGARVGYIDGDFVLNPTKTELASSQLDLVVAGTENAVLMVESEAEELPEQVMLDSVLFGHEKMQAAIEAINDLAAEVSQVLVEWAPSETNVDLRAAIESEVRESISSAYQVPEKLIRQEKLKQIRKAVVEKYSASEENDPAEIGQILEKLEKHTVRETVLTSGKRIDGRNLADVRAIHARAGLLKRTHGSALFTRGETQAMVMTTLGTERDAQIIDAIEGEYKQLFMLHYNFPPFG